MTADSPPDGTPSEATRHLAAKRVELAVAASDALTKIADSMCPWEIGFAEANANALAVDRLLATLRKQVPR